MKRLAHILAIVTVLLGVVITDSFRYTMQEVVATERADDFRESEALNISTSSIKVCKATFTAIPKVSQPIVLKSAAFISSPATSLFQFLYIRLRVLRN